MQIKSRDSLQQKQKQKKEKETLEGKRNLWVRNGTILYQKTLILNAPR